MNEPRIPQSRVGKKQIMTYVDQDLEQAILKLADEQGKTLQELVGEAFNSVCALHSEPTIFTTGHSRVFRRRRGRATLRGNIDVPFCRQNRRPIGGWFDIREVDAALAFCRAIGIPLQKTLEIGLNQITGRRDYTGKL